MNPTSGLYFCSLNVMKMFKKQAFDVYLGHKTQGESCWVGNTAGKT